HAGPVDEVRQEAAEIERRGGTAPRRTRAHSAARALDAKAGAISAAKRAIWSIPIGYGFRPEVEERVPSLTPDRATALRSLMIFCGLPVRIDFEVRFSAFMFLRMSTISRKYLSVGGTVLASEGKAAISASLK